jgi:hypothetical protein
VAFEGLVASVLTEIVPCGAEPQLRGWKMESVMRRSRATVWGRLARGRAGPGEVLVIGSGGAAGFHCRRADAWVEWTRRVKPSAMRWRGQREGTARRRRKPRRVGHLALRTANGRVECGARHRRHDAWEQLAGPNARCEAESSAVVSRRQTHWMRPRGVRAASNQEGQADVGR